MTQIYIHQGSRPSQGAGLLLRSLRNQGVKVNRLRDTDEPLWGYPVFNWGNTRLATALRLNPVINTTEAVIRAVSKVETARLLEEAGIPCVKITQDVSRVSKWLGKGRRVFARRDGLSSGLGIREVLSGGPVPQADFYSRYYPKTHEYRIHIFDGQVIDITEKRAQRLAAVNRIIRTHDNGWVYAHELSVTNTESLGTIAKQAVAALGLTFGAVDILATLSNGVPRIVSNAVICEVNTAPGLENQATINAYSTAIKRYINHHA
jgi:glutathione synthase/RimK-type ligase-like ATP-grasp enzyme